MRINCLIGLFLLLFFGACKVGPKYSDPSVAQIDSLSSQIDSSYVHDSIKDVDWFTMFEDTVLIDYINQGLSSNFSVRETAQRIEEARQAYGFVKSDLFPNLSYTAGMQQYNLSKNATAPIGTSINRNYIQANVSWEIDFWGKYRHSKDAAKSDWNALIDYDRSIRLSLIAEIATVYYKLLDLDNKLDITKRTILTRQNYYDIILSRFQYGDVSELDKLQSEQQLESIKATQYQLIRDIQIVERAFCLLLGKAPSQVKRGKALLDQSVKVMVPSGLPADLLNNRPDLRSAKNQLKSQNSKIGMAVAMRFPSIQLTGMLGLASADVTSLVSSNSVTSSIAGMITGPLFNFGKNKRRVQIEKAKFQQLAVQYEKIFLTALNEVDNSLISIDTYKEEEKHRKAQVEAARKALMLSKSRYDNGYTSYLEVLIAEQNTLSAEFDYSTTQKEILNAYLLAYKSFGGGW
jgi:multidrug efflux system outer membrane protein